MANIPAVLLRKTALIRPKTGTGPKGDLYGPVVVVRCMPEYDRRKVRTATGTEVVASLTLFCPLDTNCPPGSLVEFEGRETIALDVKRMDGAGLPTPDHLEVICQ